MDAAGWTTIPVAWADIHNSLWVAETKSLAVSRGSAQEPTARLRQRHPIQASIEEERMNVSLRRSVAIAMAAGLVIPASAIATNGYFSYGWGTKSKGMAGVATALPQSTLVSATNPAGMAFIGTSSDVSVSFFNPSPRGYKANDDYATTTYPGTNATVPAGAYITPGKYDSDSDWFLVPSAGFNYVINDRMTIGVSLFGNGGRNTNYEERAVWENFSVQPDQRVLITPQGQVPQYDPSNGFAPITDPGTVYQPVTPDGSTWMTISTSTPGAAQPCGTPGSSPTFCTVNGNPGGYLTATTPTGVNLEQLFIEVPFTYKVNERNALGISPVFAVQTFEAKGLQPFRAASLDAAKVSNNGKSWSYGWGLQVGWMGKVTDQLSLGASYRTRTWMSAFDEYKGLFAEGGDFDIPPMLNLGIAYKVTPDVTLALDYQRIWYGDVKALSNSNNIDMTACFASGPKPSYCLGGDHGLGFGWQDMDIVKFGAAWDYSNEWSFRGGVSWASDFITSGQSLFNVMAPATIKWHFTVGATYRPLETDEFSISLAYMPENEYKDTNPSITGVQSGSIYMEQKEIEISWTHHF
jgi:long-chain fatty acid transport protein